jgi:glycosyltransferase involved in cell wall biosynthesis
MITIAVMPAYNAAKTLEKTLDDIPPNTVDQVILVDDASKDNTVKLAKRLKLKVVSHPQNRGYGGNQKTCYTLALSEGADIVVMIHPDYQYDSSLTGKLIEPIKEKRFDCMLGSRIRTRQEVLEGGMPFYKYVGNRGLTILENMILGLNLSEYHTGFRAFSRELLTQLPFHKYSDDFVFDQQILFGAAALGAKIGEIPVPVRYFPEASSINFMRSSQYGLSIIRDLGLYVASGGHWFI